MGQSKQRAAAPSDLTDRSSQFIQFIFFRSICGPVPTHAGRDALVVVGSSRVVCSLTSLCRANLWLSWVDGVRVCSLILSTGPCKCENNSVSFK